jgi:hypothetical protein
MRVAPPGSSSKFNPLHAAALFTDRESQSEALAAALATFDALLRSDDAVTDLRRNVLVFHGVGGIGKTTLSERLEAWVHGELTVSDSWGPPPATKVAATARIDLHNSAGQVDMLAALTELRRSVSALRRSWAVFDLAFAAYWSAVRPHDPLPTFNGHEDIGDTVADTVSDVLGDIASLASVVAAGTGTGIGIRAVRRLIGELRRRHSLRLALRAYEGYERFLMRCAEEPSPMDPKPGLSCEVAGILAWELSQLHPQPVLCVFIDTAERLTMDVRRTAEGHINELVYGMPNVLFVVSGRNRLDWDDESRSDLKFRGSWTWPGLTPDAIDEPRQHLVGNLSPDDARTVLERARALADLPISDIVIEEVVIASSGLPQYLDLVRQVAVSIKSSGSGREVTRDDVTGSLRSLVNRVLDDIPQDERRVIRAAALFRSFDVDLVAAAAAVDFGCALRAVRRPMIDPSGDALLPYRMHDAIREAIRSTDHSADGGWSEQDWQVASTRAVKAAHDLHNDAKAEGAARPVMQYLGIAIGLVCDQSTNIGPAKSPPYEDWVSQAIVYAPSVQGLLTEVPTSSRTLYGRHTIDFIRAKSIETPLDERLRLLRGIFDSGHPLSAAAGRHLSYALRNQQRWDETLAVVDELISRSPTALNVSQRAVTLSMARRFRDASDAAAGTSRTAFIRRTSEYAHGLPERYFREIPHKIDELRSAGRQRELLEERGDWLLRSALFRGGPELGNEIDEYRDEVEVVGHMLGLRSALAAQVLQRHTDAAERDAALDRLRSLEQATLDRDQPGFRFFLASVSDAVVQRDIDRINDLADGVKRIRARSRSWVPVECFLVAVGKRLDPIPTQWLEPQILVEQRWKSHLSDYLARHNASTELLG